MQNEHIPVLLDEAIAGLNINPDGIYVDCTLGGAGHASEILRRLSAQGFLYCFDQDNYSVLRGKE
jgi:16S rRNA (cytosine1402-N4)-methyltransferase